MGRALAIAITVGLLITGIYAIYYGMHDPSAGIKDRLLGPAADYRAPLLNADIPESHKVKGSYSVFLRPGYSYEQHKAAVSHVIDLDTHSEHVSTDMLPGMVYYGAFGISDEALDAIRADKNVATVEVDVKVDIPEHDWDEQQRAGLDLTWEDILTRQASS